MSIDARSTGRTLYDLTLAGGSRALGQGAGGFVPGAPADIVSLAADHVALAGRTGDRLLDAWIFAAREPAVDCVWVRGVKQVEGGRHRERERIRARFDAAMRRLLS